MSKSVINFEIVNCVLLLVILIIVIVCCCKKNENFYQTDPVKMGMNCNEASPCRQLREAIKNGENGAAAAYEECVKNKWNRQNSPNKPGCVSPEWCNNRLDLIKHRYKDEGVGGKICSWSPIGGKWDEYVPDDLSNDISIFNKDDLSNGISNFNNNQIVNKIVPNMSTTSSMTTSSMDPNNIDS